jgi:hypothetical protein
MNRTYHFKWKPLLDIRLHGNQMAVANVFIIIWKMNRCNAQTTPVLWLSQYVNECMCGNVLSIYKWE